MSRDLAEQEVNLWLDYKRVKDSVRETQKAQIGVLIDAVQYGDVTINTTTFAITQKMSFPEATGGLYSELVYKARISIGELQRACAAVKIGDFDGRIAAYVAALTDKGVSHILKMDSDDFKVAQAIAVFFM